MGPVVTGCRYDWAMGNRKRHSAAKTAGPVRSAGPEPGAGAGAALYQALAEMWAAIEAGDVLRAELQASALVALPFQFGGTDEQSEILVGALIKAALEQDGPVAAAFLRLLVSLGPRSVKRAGSDALADLTGEGVYPPEWVTSIGKPAPGQAWRAHDVFGDHEAIIVTFGYPGAEQHALVAGLELVGPPVVTMVVVSPDAAGLLKAVQEELQPWDRFEEISLAQARRRLEGPLARAGDDPVIELELTAAMQLPIARSRVRRLPSHGADPVTEFTAADRAAAVEEFLRSPEAANGGDLEVARFWAQVLTGYSGRVPGTPPAQVGPGKLVGILLGHVPSTFTLSPAQREGMEAAVSAWTRWTAAHRNLDEAATGHLLAKLPEVFADFPDAYDDPDSAAARAYVRDIVTSDIDAPRLIDYRNRRQLAAPYPGDRDPGVAAIDATDSDGRAVLAVREFASCAPEGADRDQFMAAAKRVVEELWHDDPPETWRAASRLLDQGEAPHDVLHALIAQKTGR